MAEPVITYYVWFAQLSLHLDKVVRAAMDHSSEQEQDQTLADTMRAFYAHAEKAKYMR